MVNEVEELGSQFSGGRGEGAVDGIAVVVVDAAVLVVEGMVKKAAAYRCPGKHAFDERFEFHVTMVEGFRDRTRELNLVGLEAVKGLARHSSSAVATST